MHAFTDRKGDSWEVELTIGSIEDVKGKLEVDLLDPLSEESQLVVDLSPVSSANINRFCRLIAILCEDQYIQRGIQLVDFNKLLDTITLKGAYDAFFKEWQDFFQSLDRTDVAEAIKRIREMMKEGVTKVVVEIQKIKFPTDDLSTSSPESSE